MAMGDSVREAMHNAQYGTARREDAVTRTVESQTTAIPSIAFLGSRWDQWRCRWPFC